MPAKVLRLSSEEPAVTIVGSSHRIQKGPYDKVPGQAMGYHEFFKPVVRRGKDGRIYLEEHTDFLIPEVLPGVPMVNLLTRPPEKYELVRPFDAITSDSPPEVLRELTRAVLKAYDLGMQISFRDYVLRAGKVIFIGPSYTRTDGSYWCPFVYDGWSPLPLLRCMSEFVPSTHPLFGFFSTLPAKSPVRRYLQTEITAFTQLRVSSN